MRRGDRINLTPSFLAADDTRVTGVALITCTGWPNHGHTRIADRNTARCSPAAARKDGVRLVRRSRRMAPQRPAGGCAGGLTAPEEGPPVSVIRLILVKPELDSAAITWATTS